MAERHRRAASARSPHNQLEAQGHPIGQKGRAARPPVCGYDRRTAIARVLPLWPHELEDESPAARRQIVAKLHSALRAERGRGLAGHWTYDLARHVELLRVYRAEVAALVPMQGAGKKPGPS